jgi:DNA primase
MARGYDPQLLRTLRNDIPIQHLIADVLDWPSKNSEGYFRFLCPACSEFNSATNPKTNLGRCFRCRRNFNPIDFVMAANKCTFVQAVEFLRRTNDGRIGSRASATPQAIPVDMRTTQ